MFPPLSPDEASARGRRSIGKADWRRSWRVSVSPRDGNLPAMVLPRRDRPCLLSKVERAQQALSQREMTSSAPAAGAGEREDERRPMVGLADHWRGRVGPAPGYRLRLPGASLLLTVFSIHLSRSLEGLGDLPPQGSERRAAPRALVSFPPSRTSTWSFVSSSARQRVK